jgi:RNase II-type exonuclease C-terminal S1 domain
VFTATVVDRHRHGIVVMLHDADIVVTVPGHDELGAEVVVTLEALDPVRRTATFARRAPGPR